jgi:hypothetical protein
MSTKRGKGRLAQLRRQQDEMLEAAQRGLKLSKMPKRDNSALAKRSADRDAMDGRLPGSFETGRRR